MTNKEKQELSEWIAVNVLGWESKQIEGYEVPFWMDGEECKFVPYNSTSKIENFIFSPNGFFAVWDAVEKKNARIGFMPDTVNDCDRYCCNFDNRYIYGKDRYEAFYKAVKEVYKNENS